MSDQSDVSAIETRSLSETCAEEEHAGSREREEFARTGESGAVDSAHNRRDHDEPASIAATLDAAIDRISTELRKHHDRASHREAVIDSLHAEVELLRRGERRALLRPMLAATARLHDDLVHQAGSLPDDFDAHGAARLLQSFADSVELMLDDYGVRIEVPELGADFDARRHRTIGKTITSNAEQANKVAEARRGTYFDSESGSVLAHAEVVVFAYEPEAPDSEALTAATTPEEALTASNESPHDSSTDTVSTAPHPNGVAE